MATGGKTVDHRVNFFEAYSHDAACRKLNMFVSGWQWSVPTAGSEYNSFKIRMQSLQSATIISAERSAGLIGIAEYDVPQVNILFVLAGEVEVDSAQMQDRLHIPADHAAIVGALEGTRIAIKPYSSWLLFQVQELEIRRYFENLTGQPYARKLALSPINFRQNDARELFQVLKKAEKDLARCNPTERAMLTKAYHELILVKVFAKLPHNLRGSLDSVLG
ncbi:MULTISPECIES: hypothetical protein [Rhizobium]|uniref:AraC family transcriptional regulator n=1 Tax=Rhizobium tropici TaxID=398 RepID=A0A329YF13_RHITR|nr:MULTISPECIES: hypothetical protein [Rhizobium]MBB3290444.1 hypothetical protein [Rhizobium sp. BK252]MBB3405238.1 hypothetical protein [Rhizobium sp. BK289]MBB3417771.1 hypothetical protein [Rhizobium sp. BK284]MBB3485650.1 hypothetical protein [Rhizobium sp. BK347]MDK4722959.1 hypothetical protein [Rhizobium sp. CNPSo 3968]